MRYHLSRLATAPQFMAVLDCLFELAPRRTDPVFEELVLLDERLVFARMAGDESFRYYVGSRDELVVNLVGFVRHLGLGTIEREYVISRVESIRRERSAA